MPARIDRLVTSGTFSLDGQDFAVDNNVWLVGDDAEVIVVDAAHDAGAILGAVGERRLVAVLCTHGHNDHIDAAVDVAAGTPPPGSDAVDAERSGDGAPIHLHPDDRMLWDAVHPEVAPEPLTDGQVFEVAGTGITVLHTPGHSPGAVCLRIEDLDAVLSGDTLFQGGPGATGRSFSSYPAIVASIRTRLLTLPRSTTVLTGHGEATTIGAEADGYDWDAAATKTTAP